MNNADGQTDWDEVGLYEFASLDGWVGGQQGFWSVNGIPIFIGVRTA